MAFFAPVCPPRNLMHLQQHQKFGNYHLWLAHDVVAKKDEYVQILRKVLEHNPYKQATIIMDNSLIECGMSVDNEMVADACNIVKKEANKTGIKVIPVLADVLGEAEKSFYTSVECAHQWDKHPILSNFNWMYVAQGANQRESMQSGELFLKTSPDKIAPKIEMLSVPRKLAQLCGSRIEATWFLSRLRPVHLLGFSDDVVDDVLSSTYAHGIDSAVPLRCPTEWNTTKEMGPREDWWDNPEKDSSHILANYDYACKLFAMQSSRKH